MERRSKECHYEFADAVVYEFADPDDDDCQGFPWYGFHYLTQNAPQKVWQDFPGSFQKVTAASNLNGYEILRWAPNVANIPNVVILKSDNLKIVFVVGDPSILEINLQLARDDPETAATIMANWIQDEDDKPQGNKRARSKGNTNSEIIISAMSPDKQLWRRMEELAQEVKVLEQQEKE